jgi:hypothetical protein
VRDSLLAAQERFAELEDQPGGSRPELLAELDLRQAEILRLRDLLIGMDKELGATKGHLAALEDRSLMVRINNKIPGFRRLWSTVLRVLREG